jgi:ABC-type sugar transport system substrate-binding protein
MDCRIWPATVAALALTGAVALGALCLGDPVPPGEKKFVGVTLLNLQFPFVVAVSDAMKAVAAKE